MSSVGIGTAENGEEDGIPEGGGGGQIASVEEQRAGGAAAVVGCGEGELLSFGTRRRGWGGGVGVGGKAAGFKQSGSAWADLFEDVKCEFSHNRASGT